MNELGMKQLIRKLVQGELRKSIPIGISNRHLHVSEKDFAKLFPGKELRVKKWLKQPGEFAAEEVVTLVGPKGEIANVRILGPVRAKTQIELSLTDTRYLGIKAPICLSGQLDEAGLITLRSEFGEISVKAAIVAQRRQPGPCFGRLPPGKEFFCRYAFPSPLFAGSCPSPNAERRQELHRLHTPR